MSKRRPFTDQDALDFHKLGKPGKLEIVASKPMTTQRDLSLAYSPGVAVPVRAIADDPATAYDYTSKGNLVAVISNGTAILGLGDLGALASKPVMEGKSVLFKRFADVDSIDLELDAYDVDAFVGAVRYLGPSFGGINLEDIKAPDCFIIEQRLRELLNIPVFHDDQHGTAIITAAALLNALHLTGRDIRTATMVVNGAGSAGIACLELIKAMGMPNANAILCDTKGVIYKGRAEGMNQWKSAHAVETKARTLEDALKGADIFLGLSAAGAMTQDMVKSMAAKPIIFACANPDPEITPEDVAAVRPDAIVATGRSDYPNQVNNVLGFPYIFRGALDVRASTINEAMKIAAAEALAELAREDVPDEVAAAYAGPRPTYGPGYIIPVPFDPRLISRIPVAVARAAIATGVAQKPIGDLEAYGHSLSARLDPMASVIQRLVSVVRANPKHIVFAEGEEETIIRAAMAYEGNGLGQATLIGRPERIHATMRAAGIEDTGIDIVAPQDSHLTAGYADRLYARLQRRGLLHRDCLRLVTYDRNAFAASMVMAGDADTMLTGFTRNYSVALDGVRQVIPTRRGQRVSGVSMILSRGRTVFVADTNVHDMPTALETADIAVMAAGVARRMGFEPRVALLAYSTFGHPTGERSVVQREAVELLASRDDVDFEFDGEMAADVALDPAAMALYPFCRLTGPANVLIMPAIHSASISTKLLQQIGGATVIGPLLVGLEKSVQICPIGAKMSDIVNLAALAAYDIGPAGR